MDGLLFEILYADVLGLMAESMEGGERVISRIDPCGVCDKTVKANSVMCIRCQKWVHKEL